MRLPLALAALLVALVLGACGASVSVGDDDTETLDQPDVGFTFEHPSDFGEQKVDTDNTQGQVRALLGVDDNNLIAIRRFAPKAATTTADLKAATVSFATANAVPAGDVRLTKRSGIDMATFKTATTVDGANTSNEEWVFPAGGATWQLECQSTPERADEVRKACDMALDTIKPKKQGTTT